MGKRVEMGKKVEVGKREKKWERKSYNETGTLKKCRIAHPRLFRGTASAPFVPAQGLRAQGNSLSPRPRPLSTAVLARTTGKLPKHHASASAKSRVHSPLAARSLCRALTDSRFSALIPAWYRQRT